MKKSLIAIIILFFLKSAMAGDALTTGFAFLSTDFNARTSATSGAFTTLRGDVGSVFVNPAGLAYSDKRHYIFNYSSYLVDVSGGLAGYTQEYEDFGILNAAVHYIDYGNFDETFENGTKTGATFNPAEFAFSVGWAKQFEKNVSYGLNFKYIFSHIYENYNASAFAFDLGLLWDASEYQDNLYFGIAVLNLGYNFEYYNNVEEDLPLGIRVGFSKLLEHLPLEIAISSIDAHRIDGIDQIFKTLAVGGEFKISESLRFRLGYNSRLHSDLKAIEETEFGGISGGLGFYINKFRIDYSYSNYNLLGNTHRFGIQGTL